MKMKATPGQARAGRRRRHFRLTCVLSGSGSMLCLLPQSECECVVCRCKYLCGCGTLVATLACRIATRLLCLLFFSALFFSISPKQQQHLLSRPFPPHPCWAASGSLSDSTLRLFQLYLARFLLKPVWLIDVCCCLCRTAKQQKVLPTFWCPTGIMSRSYPHSMRNVWVKARQICWRRRKNIAIETVYIKNIIPTIPALICASTWQNFNPTKLCFSACFHAN